MMFFSTPYVFLITLPSPVVYDGMELSFYRSMPRTRTLSPTVYLIAPNRENIIRGIEKSDNGSLYVGYSTHNEISIGLDVYTKLKAFGGYWNVIEGNHEYTV